MEFKNSPDSSVTVLWVDPIVRPNDKKTFVKRAFGIEVIDTVNGNDYTKSYVMQVLGQTDKPEKDNTPMFNDIQIGDKIDVSFTINCNISKNSKQQPTEKNPDSQSGFTNLTATKVSVFAKGLKPPVDPEDLNAKKAAWDKIQSDLKDPNVPHTGMVWNTTTLIWEDDLPF